MVSAKTLDSGKYAIAGGSFIQYWLVKDWNDKRWQKEYQILKEAGMQYVVLSPTAFYKTDEAGLDGKTKTIYPTKLNGFETLKESGGDRYPDIVDACLRNAQKMGIKVFIGLNFSDEWWTKSRDPLWFQARVQEGNLVAGELWDLYHDKYPDAFYGWYWCWEVDNGSFRILDLTNSKKILAEAIKTQLDYLEETNKRLPFMLSPYMDWKLSLPQGYAMMWKYVFAHSGMKEGDIFCPQDSIGAGGLNMKNYVNWFKTLRSAVDSSPGIKFWANIETFNISDWSGATLDRFVRQLTELHLYVDEFITFSYSHYYSPNIVNPGFHETYTEYVKTGTLECIPPSVPTKLKASLHSDGTVSIKWNASSDNVGVCGYYIFKDGVKIADVQVKRSENSKSKPKAETTYIEKGFKSENVYIITYEVAAYDFAGNVSEKTEPVAVTMD